MISRQYRWSAQQGRTIMKSRVFLYVSTMAMSSAVGFFLTTSTLGYTPFSSAAGAARGAASIVPLMAQQV